MLTGVYRKFATVEIICTYRPYAPLFTTDWRLQGSAFRFPEGEAVNLGTNGTDGAGGAAFTQDAEEDLYA